MVFDLVTTVDSVKHKPDDTHEVEVRVDRDAMMPESIQKLRARGRAIISTGAVEAVSARAGDIADAIRDLEVDEIQQNTEVISTRRESGALVVQVKVN